MYTTHNIVNFEALLKKTLYGFVQRLENSSNNEMTMTMKYDNEITLFRHIFIIYRIYFTSTYVLLKLVIKTYMCPGDLISANSAAIIKPPK